MNLQDDRIAALCDALQLDRVAAEYAGIAQDAATQSGTFSDFLERLLTTELDGVNGQNYLTHLPDKIIDPPV